MSHETRQRLGAAQAQLLRALLGHAPVPPGFDSAAIEASASVLSAKRRRAVARTWPPLPEALGETFAARFDAFAKNTPLPASGGALADGRAFLRAMARTEPLPEVLLRQVLAVELRYAEGPGGLVPRRGISWVWAILPKAGEWLLGVRMAGLGERWLSWNLPSWKRMSPRFAPPRAADTWSIQLEGRLEFLERALALYTTLARQLVSRAWRRLLRQGRWSDFPWHETDLLRQAQVLESQLDDVLDRVQRRARQEKWPDAHPVCKLLRALQRERTEVEALANGYLHTPSNPAHHRLDAALALLELHLFAPRFPLRVQPRAQARRKSLPSSSSPAPQTGR